MRSHALELRHLNHALRACVLTLAAFAIAVQEFPVRAQDAKPKIEQVKINFPNEIDLRGLVDYVGARVGIHILYDEKFGSRKITVRASGEIPVDSLLSLLQSALRMSGLALIDSDTPGWKRIVELSKTQEVAQPRMPDEQSPPAIGATVVTQAFLLKHFDATQLDTIIKPFLTQPGANTVALESQRLLIVTDYASNIARVAKLVELIDRPRPNATTLMVPVRYQSADGLAAQLTSLIQARSKAEGKVPSSIAGVTIVAESRTNQLIVVGEQDRVQEVSALIKVLDVSLGLRTEVYTLKDVTAERIDRIMKGMLSPEKMQRLYQSTAEAEANLLVVTTTDELHRQLEKLIQRLDQPEQSAQRKRVKFYKLKHVRAQELLETLRAIEDGTSGRSSSTDQNPDAGRFRLMNDARLPGANQPNLQRPAPVQSPPTPPAVQLPPGDAPISPLLASAGIDIDEASQLLTQGRVQMSADVNTNSLIVIADPVVQQTYAELIRTLDQRRAQILIEAKIIVLDTSDDFMLGVEVSGGDRTGSNKLFSFSSFGLSAVNPVNGALQIIPGTGFNGALVDPAIADVVIRAFTTHKRARVISAPRVLVNDNATGLLTSVTEIPFTSVNASQTVATTSFAGFAQAGTTISVTPHISDDQQLQLKYQITLNDFQGQAAGGVPPSRITDELESEVTIPDGHTLIVGGLNRTSTSDTVNSFPFLESIPLIKYAASKTSKSNQQMSLFIFLRPVVLRDDKFRDLKYYSERDAVRAGERREAPQSRPSLVR